MNKCTNEHCNVCERTAIQEVYFSQYHSPNIVIVPTVSHESGPPAKKLKFQVSNENTSDDISRSSPEGHPKSCTKVEIISSIKSCEIEKKAPQESNNLQNNAYLQPEVNLNLKETNDTTGLSSNMEIIDMNDELCETEKDLNHIPTIDELCESEKDLSQKGLENATDNKRLKTLLSSILLPNSVPFENDKQSNGDLETDTKIKDENKLSLNTLSIDKIPSHRKCVNPNTSKQEVLKKTSKESTHSSSNSQKTTKKPTRQLTTIKSQCLKCKTRIINSKHENSNIRNSLHSLNESKGITLRSKQTKESLTSKNPINEKIKTSAKISSTSPIKSVVHVTDNYDLNSSSGKFNRNKHSNDDLKKEDLRKRLSTIRRKRDNLVVSVPNSKLMKKYTRAPNKVLQKNTKKIKLIINVICQKTEGNTSKADISDESLLQTSADVSFLDDFDVDDIVESLNVSRKEIIKKVDDVTSNIESEVKFGTNEHITENHNLVKTEPPEHYDRLPCEDPEQHDFNNIVKETNHFQGKEELCEVKSCDVEEKSLVSNNFQSSAIINPNSSIIDTHVVKDSAVEYNIIKSNIPEQEKQSSLNPVDTVIDRKLIDLNTEKLLSNLSNSNISVKKTGELNTETRENKTTLINKNFGEDQSSLNNKSDTKVHYYDEIIVSNENSSQVSDIKNTDNDNICDVVSNTILLKFTQESKESCNNDMSLVSVVDIKGNKKVLHEDYKEETETLSRDVNKHLLNFNKDSCLIESNNDNDLSVKLSNKTGAPCFTVMKNNNETELNKTKNNENMSLLLNNKDEYSSNKSQLIHISIENENNTLLDLKHVNYNVAESVITVSDPIVKEIHDQIMTVESQDNDGQKLKIFKNETMEKTNSGESQYDDDKFKHMSTKVTNDTKNVITPIHSTNVHDLVSDMKNEGKNEPISHLDFKNKSISQQNLDTSHSNCVKDIRQPAEENKVCSSSNKKITQPLDDNNEKTLSVETKSQILLKKNLSVRMKEYLGIDYEICDLIRSGKYSYVYTCKDPNGKILAAKVSRVKQTSWIGTNKETMLRKLQKSVPNENYHFVCFINSFGISRHWCFLTEYYPKNLAEHFGESRKGFHINDVQRLSRQLISAVMVLRHNNIVHSEIKPAHILLNYTMDRLKLCGFDAMRYHDDKFKVLPNIGITKYRAPEIILGFSASYSIDVWSTALIMYELATARPLFYGLFNNTILYKQMLLLGNLPQDMVYASPYRAKHFFGKYFMRRFGPHGKCVNYISCFTKSNRLHTSVYKWHRLEWASTRTKQDEKIDKAKIGQFLHLLEQMLVLHPNYRLPIEFAFADAFIYEAFN